MTNRFRSHALSMPTAASSHGKQRLGNPVCKIWSIPFLSNAVCIKHKHKTSQINTENLYHLSTMSHLRNSPYRLAIEELNSAERALMMIRPLQNQFDEVLEIPTQSVADFLDMHLQDDGADVSLTYFDRDGIFDALRRSLSVSCQSHETISL